MGENFADAGFPDVNTMVAAMAASEDQHLAAVVGFITSNGLKKALQNKDWTTYARLYNGPDYAKNSYDIKLNQAYATFSAGSYVPDLTVRTAQLYLLFLGYNPQGIDGQKGNNTLTALHKYQSANGQPLTPGIDDNVVATLAAALPPPVELSLN
jgi:peptidoglycan hydrolase-like protein with peptidoglycan-binding domain